MHSNSDGDNRIHALACMFVLLLCALLTKPYVELGISDDWGYIRIAQKLALTGHIAYDGWTTPMLGWQLYLGAAFIKLFGFSFTAVRMSILLVSVCTAWLLHRVLTAFGLATWNATLATLTILLSPVWLIHTVTFMSDASGLFCIVVCLYGCQRALQSQSDGVALAWLYFAAATNTVGGTARQIAWVGVLIIVPSTAWLLRKRKRMLIHGFFLWIAGITGVAFFMHWFLSQPYIISERLIDGPINRLALEKLATGTIDGLLSISLFALPLLIVFPAMLSDIRGKARIVVIGAFSLVVIALLVTASVELRTGPIHQTILPPWMGTNVSTSGIMSRAEVVGEPVVLLRNRIQIPLGLIVLGTAFSCLAHVLLVKRKPIPQAEVDSLSHLSWRQTVGLLVPFAIGYGALLMPRAAFHSAFDRYLLPLLIVVAVFAMRYIQEQSRWVFPWPGLVVLLIFTCFAVAGTHDLFSLDRARLKAADEVTASGVPRTSLEGGYEYDAWTEIMARGYINDPRLKNPRGAYVPTSRKIDDPCHSFFYSFAPALEPKYALAFDPVRCYVPSGFSPVGYTTWLPPHHRNIYVQEVR